MKNRHFCSRGKVNQSVKWPYKSWKWLFTGSFLPRNFSVIVSRKKFQEFPINSSKRSSRISPGVPQVVSKRSSENLPGVPRNNFPSINFLLRNSYRRLSGIPRGFPQESFELLQGVPQKFFEEFLGNFSGNCSRSSWGIAVGFTPNFLGVPQKLHQEIMGNFSNTSSRIHEFIGRGSSEIPPEVL